jgi:hypothetical protein
VTKTYDGLAFEDNARRALLQVDPVLNGIDYLEVDTTPESDNQRVLRVHFLPPQAPATSAKLDALLTATVGISVPITISGGVRIKSISIIERKRVDDMLVLRVNQPGDFSDYTLTIETSLLDPFYSQIVFNFKVACPSHFDCKPVEYCPPEPTTAPAIDYMAKDYASFRQALIDLIPTLVPDWTERRPADFGMTLLELLAYAGDQLSYLQDAIANEPYLETARQRLSVRRHARLIDYTMHDGLSAATFLHLTISGNAPVTVSGQVVIRAVALPRSIQPPSSRLPLELQDAALQTADAIFEVTLDDDHPLHLHSQLNSIPIYAWDNRQVYLPRGATEADLEGDLALSAHPAQLWRLKPGDFLLFEEVKDPVSGDTADADPGHRQVVRLTKVEPKNDPLHPSLALTHVVWGSADALTFPVCVAAVNPDSGVAVPGVSVARGNLALAYHGQTLDEGYPQDLPPAAGATGIDPDTASRGYRFALKEAPLSFHPPEPSAQAAVSEFQQVSPRAALPGVMDVTEHVYTGMVSDTEQWTVVPYLLDSGPFDQDVVVETDNLSRAILRYGDGQYGKRPRQDAFFHIIYRVGVGTVGNVGADALVNVLPTMLEYHPDSLAQVTLDPQITAVRNPLSAWGGIEAETIDQVKQLAPTAFGAEQFFAVTEADYAAAAVKHSAVRNAVATFRWTGSWHTVFLTIDLTASATDDKTTRQSILDFVSRYKLAGYDLEINDPIFVPIMLELEVCASSGYFRSDVEQALLKELSSGVLPGGELGFFNADNFTFNQSLYLSQLYERIERVQGVESVKVLRFSRRYEADPDPDRLATQKNLENGYIAVGRLEIIRLDNDPSFPENGTLTITVGGGR